MGTNESIVSIIFRITNLATIVGVFVYVFKKNIVGAILTQIEQKKHYLSNLLFKQSQLTQENASIEKTIEEDQQLCKDLQGKVLQWKAVVDNKMYLREQEKIDRKKKLENSMQQKAELYARQQLKERVLPTALEHAQAELEKKFESKEMGNNFIQYIITQVHKGES